MRILSGLNRGEKLFSPVSSHVRPTKNMVKAAMFNFIRPTIQDSYFLDLFSGSGAIGIQALCEGAKHVFFVEKNSQCVEVIKKNIQKIEMLEKATIIKAKVEFYIKHHELGMFDFIYMDPPYFYSIEQYCEIMESVLKQMKKTALLFLEYTADYDLSFLSLADPIKFKESRYGNTKLGQVAFKQ
jgi:16S rRNA (guanine966-N2)-methyltransferase